MINVNIWRIKKWKKKIPSSSIQSRNHIYIRADQGVNADLKNACRVFVQWMKQSFSFPLPVCIYLKNRVLLRTMDGDTAVGTFFEPPNYAQRPYIRVAVGDYEDLLAEDGRDNAIASILTVIAHEMTHYFQWVNGLQLTEIGYERQADRYAKMILDEYAQTREHP